MSTHLVYNRLKVQDIGVRVISYLEAEQPGVMSTMAGTPETGMVSVMPSHGSGNRKRHRRRCYRCRRHPREECPPRGLSHACKNNQPPLPNAPIRSLGEVPRDASFRRQSRRVFGGFLGVPGRAVGVTRLTDVSCGCLPRGCGLVGPWVVFPARAPKKSGHRPHDFGASGLLAGSCHIPPRLGSSS